MKKIKEIAGYVIKEHGDLGITQQLKEINLDDEDYRGYILDLLNDFFMYHVINLCGCGSPEDCTKDITKLLDAFSNDDKGNFNFDEKKKKLKKYFNVDSVYDNSLLLFMTYTLDDKELLEHGGSIGGAWITELGKMCKYVFEEYNKTIEGDD